MEIILNYFKLFYFTFFRNTLNIWLNIIKINKKDVLVLWFEASTACKNRPAIKNLAETGDLPVAALPRSIVSLTTILEKIKGTNKQTQT